MNCDLKYCFQVVGANGGAIWLTLAEANEILTFVSLILAISFTLYKLYNYITNE